MIKKVKEAVSIPVVAIGGITKENLDEVLRFKPDAICAISATVTGDIRENVKYFKEKMNRG